MGLDVQVDEFGVGDMYGYGMVFMCVNWFCWFFVEYGYIYMLFLVCFDVMYMFVMFWYWLKWMKFDFWQKEFQYIGQQEVYLQELWFGVSFEQVFGYQDCYCEYCEYLFQVVGEFKNVFNYWYLVRVFGIEFVLN